MHLLAPAGQVVFTPGVYFKFVTPEVSKNIFPASAQYG
jgi:hypothetical protein